MGIDLISSYAGRLGFGQKTGIDLPGEKDGLVPSSEWKEKTRKEAWYPGETISVAIGQGPLLVTPLQVAAHTALIANRGRSVRPHLSLDDSGTLAEGQQISPSSNISFAVFEKVIDGMWSSVNQEGTGRAAKIEDFDVCGKTGSTQTISSEKAERMGKGSREVKTHSWFTGFAPKSNPEIVVTILVEYGGMGGATAAPLAKELFELYQSKYD
jgi:penicillin-binding protein 2